MSFGPSIPFVGHFHYDFQGMNKGLAHAHRLQYIGIPQAPPFVFTPRKNPMGTFSFAAVGITWVNPLSGHMFPVRPLPGVSGGGGGGGHGTVGYGA